MSDTITLLGTKAPIMAAKRIWLRDGQPPEIRDYDNAAHFDVLERPVASIDELGALLSKVERQPRFMMIRGKVLGGADLKNALRRKANGADGGDACFEAAAHYVIPLDFDHVDCPAGFDPIADPEAAVRIAAALLPPEFYKATCWWQFTSSAGIKPGIRIRLFYWGSRPTSDQELKAWLPGDAVDHSIFDPVQAIYTANPLFEEGIDPVPVRSGLLRGDRDVVEVPDEFEQQDAAPSLGYAGWRALIGDHDGGKGFNAPIKGAIAVWVGKHGAAHPTTWLRSDIEKAINDADAGRHDDDYIAKKIAELDHLIAWTVEREAQRPAKQTQGAAVAAIADGAELFHTPEKEAYVDLQIGGHRGAYPVHSKAFRQWLAFEFYKANGKPASGEAIEQALAVTAGRAWYDGTEREVYIRVARVDGKIYLDLADDAWRAIEIDANGWRIVAAPAVRFRRGRGMSALPEPTRGGKVEDLKPFLNVDDDGFVLAVSWQLAALSGVGPYPLLAIYGEHSTAKTSTGRYIRRAIDPSNTLPSRAPPRSDRDLYVAARNSYGIHFENISTLPDWLSDTLCRLSTGGGFATRQLYEDTDEVLFRGMRPMILDGIENFVERADLADRCMKLGLTEISEEKRRGENELNKAFEAVHPAILGALLDAVSVGLRRVADTKLETLPRMADFAIWIAACELALWPAGTFKRIYDANRDNMLIDTIDGDLVADELQKLMRDKPWRAFGPQREHWEGTVGDLMSELEAADLTIKYKPKWPKNARALSVWLRRKKKALAKIGLDVTLGTDNDRKILICGLPDSDFAPQSPQKPQP